VIGWLFAIPARIKIWMVGAFALAVVALSIYGKGRSDANARRREKDLERKLETREAREEIEDAVHAKTDAARRAELERWVRPE
jgi:hypothetical protein